MSTTEGSVDLRRAPASLVTTWKYSLITYKQLVAFTKNAKMINIIQSQSLDSFKKSLKVTSKSAFVTNILS